jgi:hypothetical protein
VILSVILALVVGVVALRLGSSNGQDDADVAAGDPTAAVPTPSATVAPTPAPTPGPTGSQGSAPALTASRARGYRYIWTGTPGRRFTAREFDQLARSDALVVIEKGYGNTFRDDDAAARRLVGRNPRLVVLVDFLAGALPPALAARWGSAFQDEWILRDDHGDPLADCSDGRCSYRVDVADPAYRLFVIGEVLRRLRAAPYAGVMYDNLHYYDRRRYPDLTPSEIGRLNAGFRRLLLETRRALRPDDLLLFNGVSRNIGHVEVVNRGFDLLDTATGVQDETYCYLDNEDRFRPGRALAVDDRRYHRLAARGKVILESVHLENAAAHTDVAHIERYCFANYLMSYVPGQTYVQFKLFPNQGQGPQITGNGTLEQRLDLGPPRATFHRSGPVLERRFEHGWVFVNVGSSAARISVPAPLRLWNGGTGGARFLRGDGYTIPPEDAAFFLNAAHGG